MAYQRSLFLFHRDLRLHDNTGLLAAHQESREVIPCFIFDDAQLSPHAYKSVPGFQFLIESLEDLVLQCRERSTELLLRRGDTSLIVASLIKEFQIDAVYSNRDYTPFAQKRDRTIQTLCTSLGIPLFLFHDSLLHPPEEVKKEDGSPYSIFTPYYKKASTIAIQTPTKHERTNFAPLTSRDAQTDLLTTLLPERSTCYAVKGGRREAKEVVRTLTRFSRYKEERDIPALSKTTTLSPHNKFGTCSIREIYTAIARELGPSHELIRQLYWRDFFTQIAFHFPHVFGHPFHRAYDHVEWDSDDTLLSAWKEGRTGFPIVDAGMRELNTTGFMHNRVRMIVGSFLVKDLHIDWRVGEQIFAQRLIDYDPCVNNGSWQWVASTGCDAQPYFRIFNPWLQQEKFDPQGLYVTQWIPELRSVPANKLHTPPPLETSLSPHYPPPVIDHKEEKVKTELRYQQARERSSR